MAQLVYLKDVVTLEFNPEKCSGCGTCLEVCPHAVLARSNGQVGIVDRDAYGMRRLREELSDRSLESACRRWLCRGRDQLGPWSQQFLLLLCDRTRAVRGIKIRE